MRRTTVAYALATAATVAGALTGKDQLQRVAKPLLMPLLAVGSARRDPLLAVGLAAATVGDILMIDPDDDRRLLGGASSFAVMQVCWSTLLFCRGARPRASTVVPRVAGWAAGAAVTSRLAPDVVVPLAAYGLALGTTSTLSASPGLDRRLVVGGLLFTLSDALVLGRRIAVRDEQARRVVEGVVLLTYAGAQYLLVSGLSTRST